jgi:hypothetical protein
MPRPLVKRAQQPLLMQPHGRGEGEQREVNAAPPFSAPRGDHPRHADAPADAGERGGKLRADTGITRMGALFVGRLKTECD